MTVSAGPKTNILFTIPYEVDLYHQACHVLSLPTVVEVNFTISQPITVREGDGVSVTLRGEAFGLYANAIDIGVICAQVNVSGVPAGGDKH